jgi:hypothetical protein
LAGYTQRSERFLMRIFVYVVAKDGGFAPNPFHGVCTLACCKPKIRSRAGIGDWVLGLTPKGLGSRLVYAMRVDEVLPFADYFKDPRYAAKKPRYPGASLVVRNGDNCYEPVEGGGFQQLPSMHYDNANGRERPGAKATDLRGKNVLCSRHFTYFGQASESGPAELLAFMVPGRGHRSRFKESEKKAILAFVERLPRGMQGRPRSWKETDESWKRHSRCG